MRAQGMRVKSLSGRRACLNIFSLRSANILPRVFLKEQIRESPNPEYKRRPAS